MTIGFNENQVEMDFKLILIDEIIITERIRSEINWQKVKELAESISEIGLINPITITNDKVLIAGLHRLLAFKELRYSTIPCRIVDSLTDPKDIELIEIDENLIRNDLHFIERGEHLLRRKPLYEEKHPEAKNDVRAKLKPRDENGKFTTNETVSFVDGFSKDTASKTGLNKRTIQHEMQIAKDIDPEVKDFIKKYDIGKTDALLIAREDKEKQQQIVEKLKGKNINVKKAILQIKRQEKIDQVEKKLLAEHYEPRENIIHDSLENVLNYLEPNSVDLILTDPPYPKEFLPLWELLFEKAEKLLKDGGFLITYTPHIYLPEIFQMRNNLRFVWVISQIHTGIKTAYHPSRVNIGWKPLLVFVKGKIPEIPYFYDVLQGTGREKGLHVWQQALGEAEELIKQFSHPNQLVVDPFLGSGTTILAAKNTNRNFFGMDIDELAIKTTMRRLGE